MIQANFTSNYTEANSTIPAPHWEKSVVLTHESSLYQAPGKGQHCSMSSCMGSSAFSKGCSCKDTVISDNFWSMDEEYSSVLICKETSFFSQTLEIQDSKKPFLPKRIFFPGSCLLFKQINKD